MIKLGATVRDVISTNAFATGAATNADSTPTVVVIDQGTAMGYSPTVTNKATGLYEVALVLSGGNGFTDGHEYTAYSVVVVGGVTTRTPLAQYSAFTIGTPEADAVKLLGTAIPTPNVAGYPLVDVAKLLGTTIPTPNVAGYPLVDVAKWLGTAPTAPATAGVPNVNVKQFDGTALPSPTTAGIPKVEDSVARAAVANIAVTSAALNQTFASRTITTGSGSGGAANTKTLDAVYDDLSDATGTLDFYYEADLSTIPNAIGVGVNWSGRLVGAANSVKVYARNWAGSSWDQIGVINGTAGSVDETHEWELTSAHTESPGQLVRIRFANTGLSSSTLKTDRLLLGFVVTALSGTIDAHVVSIADAAAQAIIDGPGAIVEGSNTLADAIRGITSSVAGPVTDFRTGLLVFKSLDGSKTRWTVTLDSSGRISIVQGDLT